MVDIYSRQAIIEYAEPNYIARITWSPNDADYSKQWHFYNAAYGGINLEAAWDLDTTSPLYGGDPSIVVAVIDTGVAYKDLAGPGFWHLSTYNAYLGSGYSWWLGVSSPCAGLKTQCGELLLRSLADITNLLPKNKPVLLCRRFLRHQDSDNFKKYLPHMPRLDNVRLWQC